MNIYFLKTLMLMFSADRRLDKRTAHINLYLDLGHSFCHITVELEFIPLHITETYMHSFHQEGQRAQGQPFLAPLEQVGVQCLVQGHNSRDRLTQGIEPVTKQ